MKYILTQDQECHWYVILKEKMEEWDAFLHDPEYGYIPLPEWAMELGGGPSDVSFDKFDLRK